MSCHFRWWQCGRGRAPGQVSKFCAVRWKGLPGPVCHSFLRERLIAMVTWFLSPRPQASLFLFFLVCLVLLFTNRGKLLLSLLLSDVFFPSDPPVCEAAYLWLQCRQKHKCRAVLHRSTNTDGCIQSLQAGPNDETLSEWDTAVPVTQDYLQYGFKGDPLK